jgi:hypothetical protein
MDKKRVFVSFDFDHDDGLKALLVGQSQHTDTPFELADWSIKEHLTGDWKEKARKKIRAAEVVIILCGQHYAAGVNEELKIAQEERKPYFLLQGYKDKKCAIPSTVKTSDKLYAWTWDNLKSLIGGRR